MKGSDSVPYSLRANICNSGDCRTQLTSCLQGKPKQSPPTFCALYNLTHAQIYIKPPGSWCGVNSIGIIIHRLRKKKNERLAITVRQNPFAPAVGSAKLGPPVERIPFLSSAAYFFGGNRISPKKETAKETAPSWGGP